MTKENNKMQVDIDTLLKQNVNDLSAIKELYRKLKEMEEKISQIKYIDNTLVKKLKKEYEKLKELILDENVQLELSSKYEEINSQLNTKTKQLEKKIDEVAQSGTTIEIVQNKISEMAQDGSINFNIVTPNMTTFLNVSENLFNKNDDEIQVGKFINVNGGLSSAKGYNISGFIDVVEKQQYIYKFNKSQYGTNATYLYYGDSDILLGNAKANISGDGLTCSLTVPIGAKKIKINFIETDRNSLMFVKGDIYPSKYIEYGLIKFNESIGLNEKQKEEVRELGSSNPLEGKIISGNGDSIMYGAGYVGGFLKIIAERNNMIYENIAVSGGTITQGIKDSNTGKNRHWISATINNMRKDADYVILEGGVNDASQSTPVPIGEITNGYNSNLNVNTFCGAFESTLKQAIERFPGKKIGFVLVHKMWDGFNSSKPKNYYHYAIEILEKWGIPYVDLNIKCPPLNYINSLKTVYTKNGDGWHPNELGYKKYYCDKIEQFLISL